MSFGLTDKLRRFIFRMRYLQEDCHLNWEDAAAIAHQLEYLTVGANRRKSAEPPRSDDGTPAG